MELFNDKFLRLLIDRKNSNTLAFHIGSDNFSYGQLYKHIEQIYELTSCLDEKVIGLYATDDIRTYASILALWFAGKAYVPLNPNQPRSRHKEVIASTDLKYILSSDNSYEIEGVKTLGTGHSTSDGYKLKNIIRLSQIDDSALAYVLFTSGSTGKPKGVQITRSNLWAFLDSMANIGLDVNEEDRCLQPFDLTFDFSVSGYLLPLHRGASIYTVPLKATKFTYIASLLEDYHLTVLQMVPSMIRNLLPYLDEIELKSVRFNILCGEALVGNVIKPWHSANEKMISYNMYGPTEDTVFCTCYILNSNNIRNALEYNDVVSIGKSFKNSDYILMDDVSGLITSPNVIGELCLSGAQLTPGYWRNPSENDKRFFEMDKIRYYRTGDLCFKSESDDLMFVARKDFQVKINGFRVELEEIQNQYFDISGGRYSVVIPFTNTQGNTELAIVIEGKEYDTERDRNALSSRLPAYEVPGKWLFVDSIPLNQNGKIDRNKIRKIFKL